MTQMIRKMSQESPHDIHINKKYQTLFDPESLPRYILLTGGRGSAKSFTISTLLTWFLTEFENWKILFTRYTLKSAEISIIPEFLEKLDLLNERQNCDVTKTTITHRDTGSQIIFSGIKTQAGNQTAKLKSIPGLNVFVVDEAEEFHSEKDFDTINNSVRSLNGKNLVILILNPPTINHWIWGRFFERSHRRVNINGATVQISTHPRVHHIHTTYNDNLDYLDEEYVEEIEDLRISNHDKWERTFGGKWMDRAEGVIFDNWREGAFDESLPFVWAMDEGFWPDPLGMVKVATQKRRKILYAKEVIYETKLSTDDINLRFEGIIQNKKELIVADDKGRLINDLRKKKWNIQKTYKWPGSVGDTIRDLQDWTFIIDPESYNLKKELNHYVWNDKKASIPIDEFNHLIDPIRYGYIKLNGRKSGIRRRN